MDSATRQEHTLVVQGLTVARTFHAKQAAAYGTNVVGSAHAREGRQTH